MKEISTVLGKLSVEKLGETLCHEHVVCISPTFYHAFKNKWMNKEQVLERAVLLFTQAKTECGLSTVVDGTPIDLYRDVELIAEVSKRSGVNFIVSSGIYFNDELAVRRKSAQYLSEFFINECKNGILDTGVKPGILKCATGSNGMTDVNANLLSAIAITHNETGLPIFAHNENRMQTAFGQLEVFEKYGVDLEKLIIGHCSDTDDIEYLTKVADHGCYLGFDRIYPTACERQAKTVAEMIKRGYGDKILLSHDFYAYGDTGADLVTHNNSSRSFTTVHKQLLPALKELCITDAQIKKLTVDNPKAYFSK